MSLLSLACSSSDLGTQGTGGAGQTGGSGGFTAALQLPSCVQELLAPCTPDGTCAATAGQNGEICFDSRARATSGYESAPQACGAGINSLQVRKADGTSCYTYEVYLDADRDCGPTRHRWKDAAGTLVATGVSTPGETTTIICERTTEMRSCGEPGTPRPDCCGVTQYGGAVCPDGVLDSACRAGRCPTGTAGAGGGTGSGGGVGTAGAGGATGAGGGGGGGGIGTAGRGGTTGAAGTTGAGGSTAGRGGAGGGTAGSGGGATGTGGAAGQGGAGGNAQSCLQIEADYVAAIVGARICDVNAGIAQCTRLVSSALSCGCQIWVNDTTELDRIHAQWTAVGCTPGIVCPAIACPDPGTRGACVPASSGDVCVTATITTGS